MTYSVAIFCSGGGSNFKVLHQKLSTTTLPVKITLCVSNADHCGAMNFAREQGIETLFIHRKNFTTKESYEEFLLNELQKRNIQLILLAGYLKKIPSCIVSLFENRILNIHPSLLPKYGGTGMYGLYVHTAVLNAKEKESGATIHLVTDEYDKGRILRQEKIPVYENEPPEILAKRVLAVEHKIYFLALEEYVREIFQ